MDHQSVIDATRRWIEVMVIGLDLCPFARRVFEGDKIRYVVSEAKNEKALLEELGSELKFLAAAPIATVETTLFIHPHVFQDFFDYNDFLDPSEELLADLGLQGVIQIASFHPDYQFADTEPEAAENYTNRSPYPMLHLLREESVSAVADYPEELLEIPRRNIETLKALSTEKIRERLQAIAGNTPNHNR